MLVDSHCHLDFPDFAAFATPIAPGTTLPAPAPVFPRYIEPPAS